MVGLVDYRDDGDCLGGRHDPLGSCRLHVVSAWSVNEKRGFFGSLRSALPCGAETVIFVAGDFSFPVDGEGRLDVATDRVTGGSDSVAAHFDILFDDLIGIAQDRPARRRSEGGLMIVLFRIDRIFSNTPPGELLARNACAATLGKLTSQCELSDHVPVVARLCGRAAATGFRLFVHNCLLSLSCFPDLVRDLSIAEGLIGPGSDDLTPFDRLKDDEGYCQGCAKGC